MTEQYLGGVESDVLLADLDGDQRHAVTTTSLLVAVIAGAGSGKTRVLTRRVAHRVATGSADARHTLVLTFTREAAGELRRRLPRLGLTERVTAGTFHSIAHGLLQQRWADLDRPARTVIDDRSRIIAELVGRQHDVGDVVAELEWAASRGVSASAYEAEARRAQRRGPVEAGRISEMMVAYAREKQRRGVVDIDDLLTLTIEALEGDDAYAEGVRWRFRHLLVDEAQDLNPLQHRLVDLLRLGRDDVFLVGDPAQAIYGFTGSDPTLLLDVEARFPGVEVVRLPMNHRCTPQVVRAGTHVLTVDGQPIRAVSARPDGAPVEVVGHDDEHDEAMWVARRIASLDPTLTRTGQVGVLARTHAVLAPMRAALAAAGVGVRRVVDGPGSTIGPILQQAYRNTTNERLRRWAHDQSETVEDDPARRDPDLEAVATALLEYLREQPSGDGPGFRVWVTTTDPFGRDVDGVDLLTFHGSKGREWHTVFLLGCETSLVPHRSATTNAARAEEARLLYVAITRATDQLTIDWARRRGGYQRKRSPLLADFIDAAAPTLPPPVDLRRPTRDPLILAIERLADWRAATARSAGVLPTAICTDQTLRAIARQRPTSPSELDRVSGLGVITATRLYPAIAEALELHPD